MSKRKFKLIKEYPGSPPLGETIFYNEDNVINAYEGVIDYPEFWEEITKTYEIILVKNIHSGAIASPRYIENKKHFEIYAVKRLSDGKIFKLGDIVNTHSRPEKIERIFICDNIHSEIISRYNNKSNKGKIFLCANNNVGNVLLEDAEKIKTPLIETEDRWPVYEGDTVFRVRKALYGNYLITNIRYGPSIETKNGDLYFLKRDNADKWIERNRTKWSDEDMISFTAYYMHSYITPEPDIGDSLENFKNQK